MRDTARLQVLTLALLGACAWVFIHSGYLDGAIAGMLPETPFDVPAVSPAASPDLPHLGDEMPLPKRDPLELLRPLIEQPREIEVWIHATPPEAFVG